MAKSAEYWRLRRSHRNMSPIDVDAILGMSQMERTSLPITQRPSLPLGPTVLGVSEISWNDSVTWDIMHKTTAVKCETGLMHTVSERIGLATSLAMLHQWHVFVINELKRLHNF